MIVEQLPPADPGRRSVDAPVRRVTLLEDRAQVTREGRVVLPAGRHRLRVDGVAPVAQDVSLRVVVDRGTLGAARVARALRIRHADRPEVVTAVAAEAEALGRARADAVDAQQRAEERLARLVGMADAAAHELPEDAAWGRVDPDGWRHAFGALFDRAREQRRRAVEAWLAGEQAREDLDAVLRRLAALQRPDVDVAAAVAFDLELDAAGPVDLTITYVVPSALWRPLHRAALVEPSTLRWTRRAAIWQYTGEDWVEVDVTLSTARTSTGVAPPTLSDDHLTVRRVNDEVAVAVREVAVQRAGPAGRPPADVNLPGVDDGGEARQLQVPGRLTVPSDGRPAFVDLGASELPATVDRVAMPEALERVVVRVAAAGPAEPLLAGPVELIRGGGPFGTSEVGFVAPGAPFELSFGPDDTLRVRRRAEVRSDAVDPVDRWRRVRSRVEVDVSNVGDAPRTVTVTERLPVSELREVRIEAVSATLGAVPDADGFVVWQVEVAPGQPLALRLDHTVATAPGVRSEGR